MTTTATDPPALSSDPVNFRDLAGLPVRDGQLAQGRLFRSDDLCLVGDSWAQALVAEHGITSILDLRSPAEARRTGRGPLAVHDVAYHHLPLGGDVMVDGAASLTDLEELADWYERLVVVSAPAIVAAIALIGVERGATVFHCAAGKDRTGMLAAVILSLLGADDATIANDYARTSDVLDDIIVRLTGGAGSTAPGPDVNALLTREPRPVVLTAERSVMVRTLELLRRRRGSVRELLGQAGLLDMHVDALRDHLVA